MPQKQLNTQLYMYQRAETEPIAIIGIGCRFPGARDTEAFWHLLCNAMDAITNIPGDRFDIEALYDPRPATPGKIVTRWGGFLEDIDRFDSAFFGISPREASSTDPQHRLLLEVAWEALEDAGEVPEHLAGSETGVFIGEIYNDYEDIQVSDLNSINIYSITGSTRSVTSGRLSYAFDLRGASITVDTAASSSLVAVHLACQSLWQGENSMALAGGVNLILKPAFSVGFSQARMLAPDGRCKAFDARANGFVRSEGAGIVVLKPLSQALADSNPIYAVIRGSAVTNDGRSSGLLMTPGRQGQEQALRKAYTRAGIAPSQVQYVEAHGTGTSAGDPVEVAALAAVLSEGRPPEQPCMIGSVKTNIGHTEGAAGIAGLIKTALCLKHRMIPPSLHLQTPNPIIPWETIPILVQRELTPWPASMSPAIAGVSAFGIAGTNAHIVLEEAPSSSALQREPEPIQAQLLTLSAQSPEALRRMAQAYRNALNSADPSRDISAPQLRDICYTASVRRTHHDYRLALVAHSRMEAAEQLEAFLSGTTSCAMSNGRHIPGMRHKLVFVFSGQGSQWFGMGRRLLEQEPVFRATLEQCDRALRAYVDWSLLEQLTVDETHARLKAIDCIQPTIFAIQVALAALWRSWGITPDAVVGHSMGEVAAAHVAGILSLDDAVRVICRRSMLLKRVSGQGGMAVIGLPVEQTRQAIAGYEDRLSIAISNSPTTTVISGDLAALKEVLALLRRQKIFCRSIEVDVASHSPQMDSLLEDLLRELQGLQPQPATIPIYSTVTGTIGSGPEFDNTYWTGNLREQVLFSEAIQRLLADKHDLFIEISPHPILLSAIQQTLQYSGNEGVVLASLRRGEDERTMLLEALGSLYTLGLPIAWEHLYPNGGRCVRLPNYPWQRERCWSQPTGHARQSAIKHHHLHAASEMPEPPTLHASGIVNLQRTSCDKTQEHETALFARQSDRETYPQCRESSFRSSLLSAEPQERLVLIESHLSSRVAKVLGFTQTQLDTRQPLNRLGIDSLMAVELRNAIEVDFGIVIPITSFLQGINLNQLAQRICDRLVSKVNSASSDVAQPDVTSMLAKASQLSDQEVDALLNKLLTLQVSEEELTHA